MLEVGLRIEERGGQMESGSTLEGRPVLTGRVAAKYSVYRTNVRTEPASPLCTKLPRRIANRKKNFR